MRIVVNQHDGTFAAGLAVGGEQGAQLAHQRVRRRQRVAGGARRADGGALAAAGADIRIDLNVVAVRRDGAGRAKIEAAAATDDARARMRAKVFGKLDVARLVESAGEIARAQDRFQNCRRIAGVGAQIAVAQIGGGKQRRTAGEIEHNVAARHRAVARRAKLQSPARGRRRRGIIVDGQFERGEAALGGPDCALHHREIRPGPRRQIARPGDKHGDIEMILEQVGGLDRLLVAAIDQRHALAGDGEERRLRHRLGGGSEKRRHFRRGGGSIARPAGGLADIDEGERGLFASGIGALGSDLGENRRFLRAGDSNGPAAGGKSAEALKLGAAELAARENLGAAAGATQRLSVEWHGVLARAHHDLAGTIRH